MISVAESHEEPHEPISAVLARLTEDGDDEQSFLEACTQKPSEEPAQQPRQEQPTQPSGEVAQVGMIAAEGLAKAFEDAASQSEAMIDQTIALLEQRIEALKLERSEIGSAIRSEGERVALLAKDSTAMADAALRSHVDASGAMAAGKR